MRDVKYSKNIKWIVLIFLLSIAPIIIISIFCRPSADDYTYAIDTYHLVKSGDWNLFSLLGTAFEVDMRFYNTWQGLYSSAFVLSLQPGIFGEKFYFLGAWVLMLLLYLSVTFLIAKLVENFISKQIRKRYICLCGLFFFSVLINGLPGLLQGIYWFNGAWNYTFFFTLVLFNIGFIMDYICKEKGWGKLLLTSILSFIISGGNHVTAFLNIMLLTIILLLVFKRKNAIILPFGMAVFGFVIMYTAPGTAVRQGDESYHGIIDTLIHSAWWCFKYICEWINIQWVCFLLLLVFAALYIVNCTDFDKKSLKIHPIFLVLGQIVLMCGMLCVPYMAMGNFGKDRLINVIWLTFMMSSAINWVYWLLWSDILLVAQNMQYKKSIGIVVVLASIVVVFFGEANSLYAMEELISGTAREYAEACDERYDALDTCEGDTIYVEKLPKSELLNFADFGSNVSFWTNAAWGDYYGIDIVVADE